jgi:hypothetical protein
MKTKDLSDPKLKEQFKNRLLSLYDENVDASNDKIDDPKYEKLQHNFDRISKILSA